MLWRATIADFGDSGSPFFGDGGLGLLGGKGILIRGAANFAATDALLPPPFGELDGVILRMLACSIPSNASFKSVGTAYVSATL